MSWHIVGEALQVRHGPVGCADHLRRAPAAWVVAGSRTTTPATRAPSPSCHRRRSVRRRSRRRSPLGPTPPRRPPRRGQEHGDVRPHVGRLELLGPREWRAVVLEQLLGADVAGNQADDDPRPDPTTTRPSRTRAATATAAPNATPATGPSTSTPTAAAPTPSPATTAGRGAAPPQRTARPAPALGFGRAGRRPTTRARPTPPSGIRRPCRRRVPWPRPAAACPVRRSAPGRRARRDRDDEGAAHHALRGPVELHRHRLAVGVGGSTTTVGVAVDEHRCAEGAAAVDLGPPPVVAALAQHEPERLGRTGDPTVADTGRRPRRTRTSGTAPSRRSASRAGDAGRPPTPRRPRRPTRAPPGRGRAPSSRPGAVRTSWSPAVEVDGAHSPRAQRLRARPAASTPRLHPHGHGPRRRR